jgi:hypothetical protein
MFSKKNVLARKRKEGISKGKEEMELAKERKGNGISEMELARKREMVLARASKRKRAAVG